MSPRILLCITVYNGRAFVPQTLASAARLTSKAATVDVLVLDDCSPEPGWSEELAELCGTYGFTYYRSPRNLGIPRNVNLGLRAAMRGSYDYVIVSNSDVLYPSNLIDEFLKVGATEGVGSVTAWSNNVSIYSLPNAAPDRYLADQDVVDWVSASVHGHFSGSLVDIPAGISFCILIPVDVVRRVGLMDPVYGRGYCEETDWSLRSKALGYRVTLAPGTFVYHAGGGSNREAGLLSEGLTTVPQNEAIIDMRYPQFRDQVRAFESSGFMKTAIQFGTARVIADAGRQFGYSIEVGWLPRSGADTSMVRCVMSPDRTSSITAEFIGFVHTIELGEGDDPSAVLRELFGREPSGVNVFDRGPSAESLLAQADGAADRFVYPSRV